MYLLGIDLGTTNCKCVMYYQSGEAVYMTGMEYALIHTAEGFIEQDANLWWGLVKSAVKETVNKSGIDSTQIAALSVSSQGISFVPVDINGNVLCNALCWLDTRACGQVGLIREKFDEKCIFQRTGKRTHPAYTLPKMIWFRQNRPELYRRTWKILMGLDYITYRFTGRVVTDHSMASGTMAYNINLWKWDDEILEAFDIDIDKLPEINFAGDPVGVVSHEAAAETGLSENTLVVLGAQDQKCAAISAGIKDGLCTVSLGTAAAVSTVCKNPGPDDKMRIPYFNLDRNRSILEAAIGTSGACLKWIRNIFFKDRSYSDIDEIVGNILPGSGKIFFYPHLEGAGSPYSKPDARGFIYGLSLSTTEGEILRSLYEGIAYQIRTNIEIFEELGSGIEGIKVFGGGARSGIWCRIIADITGKDVGALHTTEAACLGAAIIAGNGCGAFGRYEEMLLQAGTVEKTYSPETGTNEMYTNAFRLYKSIQDRILA